MDGTILGIAPVWVASALLVLTYAAIMLDRINRAVVAILGACIAIVLGVLSQDQALEGVDFNTLMLLAGMMLIVGITRRTGVFEYVAIWSAKRVRAHPAGVMALLALVTALFSMLLDNVTTVLLIAPVTLAVTKVLRVDPFPFLLTQVIASNTGGTATLVGDPPNIMIGSQVGLGMDQFLVHIAPVVVVIMGVQAAIGHFLWARPLHALPEDRARVMLMDEREEIRDRSLLVRSLAVLSLVILAFLFAIVDNIPFVATMIPLLKGLAPTFGGEEALLPLWVALSLGACIGGNGTLIGASANITVAGIAERHGVRFGFLRYTRSAVGLTLLSVAICHVYLVLRYL